MSCRWFGLPGDTLSKSKQNKAKINLKNLNNENKIDILMINVKEHFEIKCNVLK